jgi:hypothetical protein
VISSKHLPAAEAADTWRRHALCGLHNLPDDVSPELWFTDLDKPADVEKAKEICTRCPVRPECQEDALDEEGGKQPTSRPGIRAALDGRERFALYRYRRDRAKKQKAPP